MTVLQRTDLTTSRKVQIVFHRGFRHVPEAHVHFMMNRTDALDAILSPT